MAAHPRDVNKRRQSQTGLPLYHSGSLLKKHSKEKNFTKFFAELRGTTLFLYTDYTQDTYVQKLDLELLKSMNSESSHKSKMPTLFHLSLPSETVQLKMENADTAELWRGYILTVTKKEIPSKLQLLPGQMVQLQETLEREKARTLSLPRPPLPPRPPFMHAQNSGGCNPANPGDAPDSRNPDTPACFFNVTRQEAERMLECNPQHGNIILRPARMANNYALTLRQMTPSGPSIKNFRVSSTSSGFVIELDKPVTVSSLNEVLHYFIELTENRLVPYTESQPYDTRKMLPAPKFVSSSASVNSKNVPQAQVAPVQRPKSRKELPPLPLPNKPDDGEYMEPDDFNLNTVSQVSFGIELQHVLKQRREIINGDSEDEDEKHFDKRLSDRFSSSTVKSH
ncbi:signal-transducing adaptor protein 1-like [Salarias fasciatus]|uniref:signal-transducing adaptor protein 1-like n=1 Tax=Salarias fasciatus TaxID=181472 RepID=UPI001176515C|nr:signal-transducing adaptor protein 1-like [Salarias fasciatus]